VTRQSLPNRDVLAVPAWEPAVRPRPASISPAPAPAKAQPGSALVMSGLRGEWGWPPRLPQPLLSLFQAV
jgi:hypothetical protein